jgi:hypothetical protein
VRTTQNSSIQYYCLDDCNQSRILHGPRVLNRSTLIAASSVKATERPDVMATDAVKRVQDKLFRGGSSTPDPGRPASPALTIDIPKPPFNPTPPPKREKQSDSSPRPQIASEDTTDSRTYRERLSSALGPEYTGVENYRLVQDGKKEKHWKRWGPYLSDRQWVCVCLPTSSFTGD